MRTQQIGLNELNGLNYFDGFALLLNPSYIYYFMNKRIMGLVVLSIFFLTMETSNGAGWYNNSWTKRKAITITGSAAGAQTNFQVQVAVSYDSDMQTDFDDIRFTDSVGTTLIDHWLETKTNSSSATFWVEAPNIPASPSTVTIYLYYGNASVSSASNGDNTFLFFDDFEGSSLDFTNKWEEPVVSGGTYNATVSDSVFHQQSTSGYYKVRTDTTKVDLPINIVVEQKLKIGTYADSANTNRNRFLIGNVTLSGVSDQGVFDNSSNQTIQYYWGAYTGTATTLDTWLRNVRKVYGTTGANSSTYEWTTYIYSTGATEFSRSVTATTTTPVRVGLPSGDSGQGMDLYTDWVFVRKYASSEPSVGTAGAEETSAGNFFLLLE